MPLLLTDQDLNELQALLDDTLMRPRDGSRLMAFFNIRQTRQQQQQIAAMQAEKEQPAAHSNGAEPPPA